MNGFLLMMDKDIDEVHIDIHKEEVLRSLLVSNMDHPFSILPWPCKQALRRSDYQTFESTMIKYCQLLAGVPQNRATSIRKAIFDWYRLIYQ